MRTLLAIGCNVYDDAHLQNLSGAEVDATRIYETLIRPEVGEYDPGTSKLLLSPTIGEVRQAVIASLHDGPMRIDTLTVFFAGHGGVANESFYLFLKDSRVDAIAPTSYCLADLFRSIHETRPAQTNIIVDACCAGGVVHDLGSLLKPGSIGEAGTPGVTIFAAAAADQTARENADGGVATNFVLDCIEGRRLVNDRNPTLDLFEIGRVSSTHLACNGQTPVAWGLNVYGAPRFCRNALYGSDPNLPLREAIQEWPASGDAAIRPHCDNIWRAYVSISGDWRPLDFMGVIQRVAITISDDSGYLARFMTRLASASIERARATADPFREAEVLGALAACLLPYVDRDYIIPVAQQLCSDCVNAASSAAGLLAASLDQNSYALLQRSAGGLPDIYLLPIRIAKCMGWAAAAALFDKKPENAIILRRVTDHILETYSLSVTSLCDVQAPYYAITLAGMLSSGLKDAGETIASLLFYSLVSHEAKVARFDIEPARAFHFLEARRTGNYVDVIDALEQPMEILTVLLVVARIFDLESTFDEVLWELDGTYFAAYVTEAFKEYSMERMEAGSYRTWQIGTDIFTCADLLDHWGPTANPASPLEDALSVISCLLLGDRTPWHLIV